MTKPLETIEGQALMSSPPNPPIFVVSSLIPIGLHILSGMPKIGKSWLMLRLCLCVSKGEPLWDFECQQGTVLYLCLDDSYERIRSRLRRLKEDAPSCLFFSNEANTLRDGLSEQIDTFVKEHPDTRLIVIDSLQHVLAETGSSNPLVSNCRELNGLRELAFHHRIAILCVKYPHRGECGDLMNIPFSAVDSTFYLERHECTDPHATLYCRGRDIAPRELKLELKRGFWIRSTPKRLRYDIL